MLKKIVSTLGYFYKIAWKEKRKYFFYIISATLLTAILPFVNILFSKYLITELIGSKNITSIVALVLCIVIGNWVFQSLISLCDTEINKYNVWFEQFFQKKMSIRAMEMDFKHTENPQVLNQIGKAEEGMSWYSRGMCGLTQCVRTFVSSAITLIGVVVIIATASPLLLIIALLAVLGGSFIVSKINKLEIVQFQKSPAINRGFHYIFRELCDVRYGKDIRLYSADGMMLKKANDNFSALCEIYHNLHNGSQKWGCVNAVITIVKNFSIYLYLGYLAWARKIGIGDLTMLITAAHTFKDCLQSMITQLQELHKRTSFMSEYQKFMEYEDVLVRGKKVTSEVTTPIIEFRNVSFRYPRVEEYVLKDINITINPNEHLSVVGLNGAGKTTFIKLLCRLYDVTEGEILINGVNIQEYDYEEYLNLFSVVFQDFKLLSMSIADNIRLGDWEKENVDINQLCELCGLKDKTDSMKDGLDTLLYKQFDRSGIEPSGGEAQKIALARALYKGAPIVVLDEPTAALDPVAEYEIYKHFDQLVGGKTAVYISHRLSSCKFCDKIVVFGENGIAEYGTHDELVKQPNGIYAEMFQAQAQYYV